MRKKLFAIVMSMTMVASFMPSLAFAAAHDHTYAITPNGSNEVTWTAVKGALADADKAPYVNVVKAPTATEVGEVVLTCTAASCDESYDYNTKVATITAGHDIETKKMSAKEIADKLVAQKTWSQTYADSFLKDAKTSNSNETFCYYNVSYCLVCDKIEGGVVANATTGINGVDHNRDHTTGCNTMAKCLDCGEVVKVRDVATITDANHTDSGKTVVVTEATCTAPAQVKKVCSVCGEAYGTASADPTSKALGHSFSKAEVTKTEAWNTTTGKPNKGYYAIDGYKDEYGQNVTKYFKYNAVAKVVKNATAGACTDSYRGLQCENCGKFVKCGTDHSANITSMTMIDNAATSMGEGSGYKVADNTHDFVTEEIPATCGVGSNTKKTCKDCDYVEYAYPQATGKPNTALDHNYVVKEVAGDCQHDSTVTITCSNKDCPEKIELDEKTDYSATNHIVKSGSDYYFKGVNDELVSFIKLPMVDETKGAHKMGALTLVKAADCTSPERYARKCTVCGKVDVKADFVTKGVALGHKLEKVVVAPTCGKEGYTVEKCSVCDKCKANDGTISVDIDADTVRKSDKVKPLVALKADHTGEVWSVTKAATVFEEGVKTLVCPTCGAELGAKTPVAKKTVAKAAPTVKAGKKSLTVKATAANATGYRVYYKKAGAKSWKSYTKKTTSLSKTFSGLSKGKYYVKVRAYAKNYDGDGQVVWGATSSTKSVKVK